MPFIFVRLFWLYLFNWRVISLGTRTALRLSWNRIRVRIRIRSWIALRHALHSDCPWFIACESVLGTLCHCQSGQKVRRALTAGAEMPTYETHQKQQIQPTSCEGQWFSHSQSRIPTAKRWWWPAGNIPQTSNLWASSCPAANCWHNRNKKLGEGNSKAPKQTANTKLNKTTNRRKWRCCSLDQTQLKMYMIMAYNEAFMQISVSISHNISPPPPKSLSFHSSMEIMSCSDLLPRKVA